jgi:hypothetical protein
VTRKPARDRVAKRRASGPKDHAPVRGDGQAATRRPSPAAQPHAGPEAGGERPQPSGSAFIRKSSPATAGRPSGGASPSIPPRGGREARRPSRDGRQSPRRHCSPLRLKSRRMCHLGRRIPHLRPPRAAPTTTLPRVRPPRLALRSGSTPVEVSSFTCRGLQDVEPQALGVTYWFDAAPDGAPLHRQSAHQRTSPWRAGARPARDLHRPRRSRRRRPGQWSHRCHDQGPRPATRHLGRHGDSGTACSRGFFS